MEGEGLHHLVHLDQRVHCLQGEQVQSQGQGREDWYGPSFKMFIIFFFMVAMLVMKVVMVGRVSNKNT